MMRAVAALTRREILRLGRNPQAIFTSLLLPILYLLLFGQAFDLGRLGGGQVPHQYFLDAYRGAPTYFSYFAAGMTGFVAVTATLFLGANVIFDRLFGVLKRTTATPASASAIFGSRLVAGSIQPIGLAFLVLGLSILLGHVGLAGLQVTAAVSALGILEIILALVLLSMMFAALFLAVGFSLEQPQTYFAVVNLINLPVLLTSAALFPWGLMPPWFKAIASFNPITLAVEVLRVNLFAGAAAYYPYSSGVYLLGLLAWAIPMFAIAAVLARRALGPKR
ncbi:MAG TPA: ABC transporter permease [Thermoplasmata archaeon]|nr:ABC transporter permease [Thermoplasmata archaeon]